LFRLLTGKTSDRKARLYEAACLHRLRYWPGLESYRWTVAVRERQADGAATAEEARSADLALREARGVATWVMGGMWNQFADDMENQEPGAWPTAGRTAEAMLIAAGRHARLRAGLEDDRPTAEQRRPEEVAQADLLRCIFGNPFRPGTVSPAWLTWSDGTIPKLAAAIYEEHAFDRLPVLADALEDTGCTDPDLLAHCRAPGPHARGCWAVDLLLGKD
jgi:hypothetical protein